MQRAVALLWIDGEEKEEETEIVAAAAKEQHLDMCNVHIRSPLSFALFRLSHALVDLVYVRQIREDREHRKKIIICGDLCFNIYSIQLHLQNAHVCHFNEFNFMRGLFR